MLGFVRHVLRGEDDIEAVHLWHEAQRDGRWLYGATDFEATIKRVFGDSGPAVALIDAITTLRRPQAASSAAVSSARLLANFFFLSCTCGAGTPPEPFVPRRGLVTFHLLFPSLLVSFLFVLSFHCHI